MIGTSSKDRQERLQQMAYRSLMDESMMDMCAMEKIQVKSLFTLNNTFELKYEEIPQFF